MSLRIVVLGSCLLAASAAGAAEPPANSAGQPWPPNQPPAASPALAPKDAEIGVAVANGPSARPPESGIGVATGAGPKPAEIALPARAGAAAEYAPDPPGLRSPDALPAVFQQDTEPSAHALTTSASTPAASAPASAPSEPAKPLEPPPQATLVPLPLPVQLPATAPAAGYPPPSPSSGTSAAATPSSPAAQSPSTAPLSLGSHADKNAAGRNSPLSAIDHRRRQPGDRARAVPGRRLGHAQGGARGSLLLPREVFDILGRARSAHASRCNSSAAATSCCWSRSRPPAPRP